MRKLRWFNVSGPYIKIRGRFICPVNLFNRVCADGDHYWGFGVLQIGHRHLLYVGHSGRSVLFMGQTL